MYTRSLVSLQSGTRLGPYEILDAIGAGGMGEVYRARDSRLQRDVALKVLPEAVARDPERLARFEREAQVLASLNHPHIAHIHGVEESNSTRALVMELVDGPTLADRIAEGPIPLEDALPIARQIAEALEAAHDAGIVHRDLKPANVKVRRDGAVKILDFGLAKSLEPIGGSDPAALMNSPTLTSPVMTRAGVILGTAAYMAPEQAKGKAVDRRADVWAFGAILFEMVTGRCVFTGDTITDVLASIVRDDPDWSLLPATTPVAIRRLLRRCLDKDPARRLRHAGDAVLDIDEAASNTDSVVAPVAARRSRARTVVLVLSGFLVAATAGSGITWMARPPQTMVPLRKLPLPFVPLDRSQSARPLLSPDGRRIAYMADGRLWVRDFDRLQPREVAGSKNGVSPFWAADGRALAFGADRRLWISAIGTGDATAICNVPDTGHVTAGAWNADGTITFAAGRGSIYSVSERGGEPYRVVPIDPKREIDFHQVLYLPDRKELLFATHHLNGTNSIEVLVGDTRKTLLNDADEPLYSRSTGHLLYVRNPTGRWADRGLWAVPFSSATLTITGPPFLVQRGVDSASAADDGTLLLRSFPQLFRQLVLMDRGGKITSTVGDPQMNVTMPALSPDGDRIAVSAESDTGMDIWIHEMKRGTRFRVAAATVPEIYPAWSPKGDRVLFVSTSRGREPWISIVKADGGEQPQPLVEGNFASMTPDEQHVIHVVDQGSATDLWYTRVGPDGRPIGTAQKLAESPARESVPHVSPDGRWVAYVANELAQNEIFVRRFPDGGGRVLVSRGGGYFPRWTKNGNELVYLQRDVMISTEIELHRDKVVIGVTRQLFNVTAAGASSNELYDVSRDGDRFVLLREVKEGSAPPTLTLVQNWFAEFAGDKR